jgi:uncharacterized protein (TIGR03435 family)
MRAAIFLLPALLTAQTPQFEVASIRVSDNDGNHESSSTRGQFRTHNISVKRLMMRAYQVQEEQISGGPDWAGSLGFDINAKIPIEYSEDRATYLPPMIQNLLADRFGLSIHREPREASGYALVVAKKGPKIRPAKDAKGGSHMDSHNTHLTAKGVNMDALARYLSGNLEKIVADKTGIAGSYDFELDWAENPADDRPSLFTALQEQLGLKLEAARVPYSAIVIDQLKKPDAN